MDWIILLIVFLLGFVIGILFSRRNRKKVEKAYDELKIRFENLKERIL